MTTKVEVNKVVGLLVSDAGIFILIYMASRTVASLGRTKFTLAYGIQFSPRRYRRYSPKRWK